MFRYMFNVLNMLNGHGVDMYFHSPCGNGFAIVCSCIMLDYIKMSYQ